MSTEKELNLNKIKIIIKENVNLDCNKKDIIETFNKELKNKHKILSEFYVLSLTKEFRNFITIRNSLLINRIISFCLYIYYWEKQGFII